MSIDHIGLTVANYERSKAFYTAAFRPLGVGLIVEVEGWAGFGTGGKPEFWFGEDGPAQASMHIAFSAADRAAVRSFHAAALDAGATDKGLPGIREIYHPDYYGAFVIDPDGHNIEAACHRPDTD